MSSENQQLRPTAFIAGSTLVFLVNAAFLGIATYPVLQFMQDKGAVFGGFAATSILVFAFLMTQESIQSGPSEEFKDLSLLQKIVMTLIAIGFYNLVIFTGAALSALAYSEFGATAGILVAAGYPIWDNITMRNAIPLSAGGLVTAIVGLLMLIGALGSRAVEIIQDIENIPFRQLDLRRLQRRGGLN